MAAEVRPFPRVFWVALLLELLERLAFYGVYVNLTVYLTGTVGLGDRENGALMGVFAAVRSWLPVPVGALADTIGFRRSLAISFALYASAYATLFALPSRPGAWVAVMGMAVAGAFLKPVIPGTVRRYAPEERRQLGFSLFYASVNAGSVIGKVGTKIVRTLVSLRASMINAIVACVLALGITLLAFREPELDRGPVNLRTTDAASPRARRSFFSDLAGLARQAELCIFLLLIAGYYLLIEQFYQTFPTYIVRHFGDSAPREYITLINPASIALLQVGVARVTARLPALPGMALGVLVGAGSMLAMGAWPTLTGACASFFVFALAEMLMSPRYYEYISSFAPSGREGLYMGLAIVPVGIGGLVGGVLSGSLVERYLPKDGAHEPLRVWGTYAVIGLVCSLLLFAFAAWARARARPRAAG